MSESMTDEQIVQMMYRNRRAVVAAIGVWVAQKKKFQRSILAEMEHMTDEQVDQDFQVILASAGCQVEFGTLGGSEEPQEPVQPPSDARTGFYL